MRGLIHFLCLVMAAAVWADLPPVVCDGIAVCREDGTGVPLMVLPRAATHLYADPACTRVAAENIPAFIPLYVFVREVAPEVGADARPRGRYRVAVAESGPPAGWLRAEDVLEWRQALTAAYTHPGSGEEERQRVLMFHRAEDIDALLEAPQPELAVLELYRRIARGDIPTQVLSKEPQAFVDINRQPYLLPIVAARRREIAGDELLLVQLASALPGQRANPDAPDILINPIFYKDQRKSAPAPATVKALRMDVVFVIDMTLSMQPYMDRTREALKAIVRDLAGADLDDRFRFGLVGFRDDIRLVPALEFVARDFTPDLVRLEDFIQLLDQKVHAATVSSVGYSEDLFAGVSLGLDSAWRDNSLHVLILVGDASGHPPGHPQSSTSKDAEVLAAAAQDRLVHIYSIQLLNPRHPEDQPPAEAQFGRLAQVRGGEARGPALIQIRTDQEDDYKRAVEAVSRLIVDFLNKTREQGAASVETLGGLDGGIQEMDSIPAQAVAAMKRIIRSAMVEYLGQDAVPPRDLLVWAADRDLTNSSVTSLEVRVLLTKEQLNDLSLGLERVLQAMQEARLSNLDFFDALQGLAAQTMKQPDAIARLDRLSQSGLLPRFIESLPYRSEILSLDRERYASLTAEQRADLLQRLTGKLSQYRTINESVDDWGAKGVAGDGGTGRYPLRLDLLP